jgi:hypothetical protein
MQFQRFTADFFILFQVISVIIHTIKQKNDKGVNKRYTYDKITLSQGLTRAKIIAFKLRNEVFQNWVKKELEGYEMHDPSLPDYRKIPCTIRATVCDDYGYNQQTITLSFTQSEEIKRY